MWRTKFDSSSFKTPTLTGRLWNRRTKYIYFFYETDFITCSNRKLYISSFLQKSNNHKFSGVNTVCHVHLWMLY